MLIWQNAKGLQGKRKVVKPWFNWIHFNLSYTQAKSSSSPPHLVLRHFRTDRKHHIEKSKVHNQACHETAIPGAQKCGRALAPRDQKLGVRDRDWQRRSRA